MHLPEGSTMYSNLLVPVDGTELSERAAQASLELAKKLGARITGFVAEPMPPLPTMSANMTAYQRDTDAHQARTDQHAHDVLAKFKPPRRPSRACPSTASSSAATASTTPSSRPRPNSAAT
jgi:nucleotide-binding universal stress UspA family protein